MNEYMDDWELVLKPIREYWKSVGLPPRVCTVLAHQGIKTKDQLAAISEAKFRSFPDMGQKYADHVRFITGWEDTRRPPLSHIKTDLMVNELRRRGFTVKDPTE